MIATMRRFRIIFLLAVLFTAGCAKRVRFEPLPLARGAKATGRVELTYDQNNTLDVRMENLPDPSSLNPQYSRYVLWVSTPDRQHIVNAGQMRVDETNKAQIKSLTPFREFILFITAESRGDAQAPGPDVVFQSGNIQW
ncbi:MAG: hypothetical protein A3F68_01575 [Acidobacteria bacterium RIFCSPLOWO2_12_FULL_54_10]|nr:MAG: hypothetical protein A3F68_01575 [Acidobacteria bacterium RIFCSPLOWO2_12_FULL_54_10]